MKLSHGQEEALRRLPSVDALLQTDTVKDLLNEYPRKLVLESIRQVLDSKRKAILLGTGSPASVDLEMEQLLTRVMERLQELNDYTLREVINGTGIVVHTNLGRSLLPRSAIERLQSICQSYNNLEYDLDKGQRGSRYVHAEDILRELTGAEAALVVNNNAGAVFLVLNTLANGREVVVSRGQLVEIGGSFRIPDVMRSSGAILREVGTTNRTHLRDYEAAIHENTALIMKVHTSNYRIIGFTAEVPLNELAKLGREKGVPVVEDLGSGSLVDFAQFGLHGEPTVQDALKMGADVVTFSGDKLLGGPQAGIILGGKELIGQCRKNPLTRAFRVDKMTLAALEATLRLYRDERMAREQIPTLRMITMPLGELELRARELAGQLRSADTEGKFAVEVCSNVSQVGGGSLPGYDLETRVVSLHSENLSCHQVERFFRKAKPPIIGRIESDHYLLDVRTLRQEEFDTISHAFGNLLRLMPLKA